MQDHNSYPLIEPTTASDADSSEPGEEYDTEYESEDEEEDADSSEPGEEYDTEYEDDTAERP